MTEHKMFLEWNTLSIQEQIVKHLEERLYKVSTSLGLNDNGNSAFIVEAKKNHCVILVDIANEDKFILIRGGLDGQYLPFGQQKPQFKQKFNHTEIAKASEFFVKVVNHCSDHDSTKDVHYGYNRK